MSENFPGAWLWAYWHEAWCKWNSYIPPASQSRGTTPTGGNPNSVYSDSAERRHPKVVSSFFNSAVEIFPQDKAFKPNRPLEGWLEYKCDVGRCEIEA